MRFQVLASLLVVPALATDAVTVITNLVMEKPDISIESLETTIGSGDLTRTEIRKLRSDVKATFQVPIWFHETLAANPNNNELNTNSPLIEKLYSLATQTRSVRYTDKSYLVSLARRWIDACIHGPPGACYETTIEIDGLTLIGWELSVGARKETTTNPSNGSSEEKADDFEDVFELLDFEETPQNRRIPIIQALIDRLRYDPDAADYIASKALGEAPPVDTDAFREFEILQCTVKPDWLHDMIQSGADEPFIANIHAQFGEKSKLVVQYQIGVWKERCVEPLKNYDSNGLDLPPCFQIMTAKGPHYILSVDQILLYLTNRMIQEIQFHQ